MSRTIFVVGMEPLDAGPEGRPDPEIAFSTRASAEAWGRKNGEALVGTKHWWGTVTSVDDTYEVSEIEFIEDA